MTRRRPPRSSLIVAALRLSRRFPVCLAALSLCLAPGGLAPAGWAQTPPRNFSQGLGPQSAPLPWTRLANLLRDAEEPLPPTAEATLGAAETRLYGRVYAGDSIKARLDRLDRTLFGQINPTPRRARLQAIVSRLQLNAPASARAARNGDARLLAYMEERLFTRTFEAQPIEERLTRLESYVFGRVFATTAPPVRLRQLSYAMPLATREVRAISSSGGVATTASRAPDLSAGPEPDLARELTADRPRTPPSRSAASLAAPVTDPLSSPLPAMEAVTLESPSPTSFSAIAAESASDSGDYAARIYRRPDGATVRWTRFPVRVYTDASSPEQAVLVARAVAMWQSPITPPLAMVDDAQRADIVIAWTRRAAPGPYPITRPILTLDEGSRIRTAALIDLSAPSHAPTAAEIAHELGHALGLWGHSDDPQDLMAAMHGLQREDIPLPWDRGALAAVTEPASGASEAMPASLKPRAPSARDFQTLRAIYARPADDLARYSPYR